MSDQQQPPVVEDLVGIIAPSASIGVPMGFSTAANDVNGAGYIVAGEPPITGTPGAPDLAGPGGFLSPGSTAQNIVTDVNVAGVDTPGGLSIAPATAVLCGFAGGGPQGWSAPGSNDGDADDYLRGVSGTGLNAGR